MNAIILAAGLGSRLLPITSSVPKPLLNINGQTIIERQIRFLKETGIDDIHIVIGYLHDAFQFLKKKHDVNLIYNSEFNVYNNFYSLYLAREYFGDSYVIEGDVFLHRNFFQESFKHSTYFSGIKMQYQNEWILKFTNKQLESILLPHDPEYHSQKILKRGAYVMSGISYWTASDATLIVKKLEGIVLDLNNVNDSALQNLFWDNIVVSNLDSFDVRIQPLGRGDWSEVDSLKDLTQLRNNWKWILKVVV